MNRIETEADLVQALAELAALCPHMARAHADVGIPPLRRWPAGLETLVRLVIDQQVSLASAAAIRARFSAAFPGADVAALAAADDTAFVACGLSRNKIRTIRALAEAVADGTLDLGVLDAMDDDAVRDRLTALPGIGPWTADMYLLAGLGRRDAWPGGDLALQVGWMTLSGADSRPDVRTLAAVAERWRPWRAVAARLLWSYYARGKTPQREGLHTPVAQDIVSRKER